MSGRTVRDRASVSVSEPVDGTVRSRTRGEDQRQRVTTTHALRVDERVMRAARAAMRPGERLSIISATEVRLVPKS